MLTADLVDVRRKGTELTLRPLDARAFEDAFVIARALLDATRGLVGARREEVVRAWEAAAGEDGGPAKRKIVLGLRKLVEDGCTFEAETPVDPAAMRLCLFVRAARARRERTFDRRAIIEEVATEHGIAQAEVERGMFADLRGEHLLREPPAFGPDELVHAFDLGRAQAVLLTAVRVTCEIRAASPGALRAFFTKLKFHQLLFEAKPLEDGEGFRVVVDGPFSMFEASTKYGLRLALLLPALRELDDWSLVAEVRWGKERTPLVFRLDATAPTVTPRKRSGEDDVHLGDDVRELLADLRRLAKAPWKVKPATALLDLPGVGVCVPDLVLERKGERPVYVEVLGYWSRDAVWRRVELARKGVGELMVFAVSSRLRVSAEVLTAEDEAALYVYKGRIAARPLFEKVTLLAQRSSPTSARKRARSTP